MLRAQTVVRIGGTLGLVLWMAGLCPADPGAKGRPNRLARETSPYLLLHAHNPVDWYPWGPEALEKAKRENKLIFLSIGYSSCYWCHVMERKVFENEDIARYMNEHFVCIKVDREERPEIDDVYMTALLVYQQATGSDAGGGWPLSMFLTPDAQPVAGGTYFPPEDKDGTYGFPTVMRKLTALWKDNHDQLVSNAKILTTETQRLMRPRLSLTPVKLTSEVAMEAGAAVLASVDPRYGGVDFRTSSPVGPKFPSPGKLALLQTLEAIGPSGPRGHALALTLDQMALGGLRDHLGGGFHRYSVDREWKVPHFEKMLYDQAQLLELYARGWEQQQNPLYRQVADEIFHFVMSELASPAGGFYAALDAETKGIEGAYYVWSAAEIEQVLGSADAKLFRAVYEVVDRPEFEHGNVLRMSRPLADWAAAFQMPLAELEERLAGMRRLLLAKRRERPALLRDDKILTAWNGLMIRGLAQAGRILQRPEYVSAAERAANFVLANLRTDDGRLLRTHTAGKASLAGYLEDYAFLIDGLLALHQATQQPQWLTAARKLQAEQDRLFGDGAVGGYYFTATDHGATLARIKTCYDSAIPAGNSVAARNLVALTRLTGEAGYRESAERTLKTFSGQIVEIPRSVTNLAIAMVEFAALAPASEVSATVRAPKGIPTVGGAAAGVPEFEGIVLVSGEAVDDDGSVKKKKEVATAQACLSVDRLPAGGTCQILVRFKLEEGWHANANPPSAENYIPTTLTIESALGCKLLDAKYPKGKPFKMEDTPEPVSVYEGAVEFRGMIEIPAEAAGKVDEMEIKVKYQACNAKTCLAPKVVSLKGKIAVAGPGETVKQINAKHFPVTAAAPSDR